MIILKILKLFLIVLIVVFVFIIYELTNINFNYINKSFISINVNNIRNPQVKKIVRSFDNYFSYYYFKISKKKKDEFYNKNLENYKKSPDTISYKTNQENLTKSNNKNPNNSKNWLRSHGNHHSNKYSSLKKINLNSISNLDLKWTFEFDEKKPISGNPIVYNGNIFLSSTKNSLISINVESGKKSWEYITEGAPAIRGLLLNEKTKNLYLLSRYF